MKIRDAMYSFQWPGTSVEAAFGPSQQSKFIPANFKDDWALVRRIDDAVGAPYTID